MRAYALVLLALVPSAGGAQTVDTTIVSPDLRALLVDPGDPEETAWWAEFLNWRMEHPLDPETSSDEELLSLPGASPMDVHKLRGIRTRPLPILPGVDTIRLETAETPAALAPFLQLPHRSNPVLDFRLWRRWRRSGEASPVYSGSRLTIRPLEGLLGEVQWEERSDLPSPGSAVRGGIRYQGSGLLRNILIGDFQLHVAEGVVFGSSLRSYPGVDDQIVRPMPHLTMGVCASAASGARLYSGVAVSASPGVESLSIGLLCSGIRRSGLRLEIPMAGEEVPAISDELDTRWIRSGQERAYGGRIDWTPSGEVRIGCSGMVLDLRGNASADGGFTTRGIPVRLAGIDFSYYHEGSMVRVEVARHSSGASGISGRVTIGGSGGMRIGMGGRWFDPGFWNPHTAGVGQDGDTRGERTGWAGVLVVPLPWLTASGSLVFTRKTTFQPGLPIPLWSSRLSCRLQARMRSGLVLTLGSALGSTEVPRSEPDSLGRSSRAVAGETRCRLRCSLAYRGAWGFSGEIRSEGTWISSRGRTVDRGLLLGAAVEWRRGRWLSLETRFVLFDSDSYDARLISPEYGPPGRLVVVPLYGVGMRAVVRFRCSPWESVMITGGVAETALPGDFPRTGRRQVDVYSQINLRM